MNFSVIMQKNNTGVRVRSHTLSSGYRHVCSLVEVSQYHHVLIGLEPWKLSEHTGSGSEDVTFMCNGLELASLPAVCHSLTYL